MTTWGTPNGPHGGAYRPVAVGRHGMAATGHPLATATALRILMDGGNAMDAGIAATAVLSVVEPYESGVGGGGYLLFHEAKNATVHCLNYVGLSPRQMVPGMVSTREDLYHGPRGAIVPAAPAGWLTALDRFGSIDRRRVLADAITYAVEGFPVTIRNAGVIAEHADVLAGDANAAQTFLPHGRPPGLGEVIRQPALASTLRTLADGGVEAFYRGPVAGEIVRFAEANGGLLTADNWRRATRIGSNPYADVTAATRSSCRLRRAADFRSWKRSKSSRATIFARWTGSRRTVCIC